MRYELINDPTGSALRKVYTDDGALIGAVMQIQMPGQVQRFAADAHDWNGDSGGEYDPISLGVFDDPDQALAEIERRAYEAQS